MSLVLNRRTNWTVPPSNPPKIKETPPDEDQIKCKLSGIWWAMHETARWANTPDRHRFFSSWVRQQVNNLPCETCVNHGKTYIRQHPPEGENPSVWTWRYHNHVNKELGKPEMKWEDYKNTYTKKNGGCTTCGR